MRLGGPVPLGYDVANTRLIINPEEAKRIRLIYQRYLELGCITKLARHLASRRIHTKATRRPDGTTRGGIEFSKGPLACVLKNRTYIGEVVHKGQHYPGEHEPILERALFEAVQEKLASQSRARWQTRINNGSLLTGRIFDDRGNRMTPDKGGRDIIAVTRRACRSGRHDPRPPREPRFGASAPLWRSELPPQCRGPAGARPCRLRLVAELVERYVEKIVIKQGAVEIVWANQDGIAQPAPLTVSWSPIPSTRKREIILPADGRVAPQRSIRSETRARLIEGIAKARLWLEELVSGHISGTKAIADRGVSSAMPR
jgi:site-specific DNA recombinase